MQSFIFICLCASVLAAPQGYQYNQEQSGLSIGIPNFSINSQAASAAQTQEDHSVLQQAVNSGSLQQALLGVQNSVQSGQQFSTAPNFQQQQNFGFSGIHQQQQPPLLNSLGGQQQQQQPPLLTSFGGQQQQHQNNFGEQPQQQQFNNFQQQYQSPGTVTKDIYVHVAPEDAQEQQYQQHSLPPPPPRKHYRIVFIKAPTQTNTNAALRIQQAPTEEKTIIYVLTKKADPLDLQAVLQNVQPKVPSKPEVYFIKYKTKEEAQHAQRTIQAQYDQLGGTSQVSDEGIAPVTSVIGSLDGPQSQLGLGSSQSSGHTSGSSSSSVSSSSSDRNVNINSSQYLPPIVKF